MDNALGFKFFLPRLPDSRAELDVLMLTVLKSRVVHTDGVKFSGFRYISPTLAGYIGEKLIVRYDPRDVAEISLYHNNSFVCRAVCSELAGKTVTLNEIISARKRERIKKQTKMKDRAQTVDALLKLRNDFEADNIIEKTESENKVKPKSKLKRYKNE